MIICMAIEVWARLSESFVARMFALLCCCGNAGCPLVACMRVFVLFCLDNENLVAFFSYITLALLVFRCHVQFRFLKNCIRLIILSLSVSFQLKSLRYLSISAECIVSTRCQC